jgi:hypothetical protein
LLDQSRNDLEVLSVYFVRLEKGFRDGLHDVNK